VIDALASALRANACTVWGPLDADGARAAIVGLAQGHELVAVNDDVGVDGVVPALRDAAIAVLEPGDPRWSQRLPHAGAGITGARLAVVDPAAIALESAPGSPRATSLVPGAHVCVVRVDTVVATFAGAMARVAADSAALPSALTWVGGPSRTGDLEMVTTLGVHGPRAVDVVLLA
jgi:L-lactate dehydrogenase complex protein LldG